MKTNQAHFPVRAMCRVLGLSPSGYYAWLNSPPSARARRDVELTKKIRTIFETNRKVYGRPRILAALKEQGKSVGRGQLSQACGQYDLDVQYPVSFRIEGRKSPGAWSCPARLLLVPPT